MASSFPSVMMTSIDVPEPENFEAKFVYSYFTPDEKLNDTGIHADGNGSSVDLFTGKRKDVLVKTPRFAEFSFKPVTVKTNALASNVFVENISKPQNVKSLILKNFSKIQSELEVSSKSTSALVLQDASMSSNISRLMELSTDVRAEVEGDEVDKAQFLNSVTSDRVSGDLILEGIIDPEDADVTYVDQATERAIHINKFKKLQELKLYTQINDRYMGTIIRAGASNSLNPFSDRMSEQKLGASKLQDDARLSSNSAVMSENEYTSDLIPISYKKVEESDFNTAAKVIGYIIDKQEIYADGTTEQMDPIVLTSPLVGAGLDSKIKYGSAYSYSIRAIAMVQMLAISPDTGDTFAVTGLISSRPSRSKIIRCIETTPPPHPSDVNFVWDYSERLLNIMWSFPPNSQRDIKRFQVFRRKTVDEPFELLMEYDFDDSELPEPRVETPRASSVLILKHPLTFYIDDEFTKDSSFIYAMCCVDAHDMSSNYSIQYRISFDRYKNTLVKELVSKSGAPKPYPNFYLESGLTVDSMKDSHHYSATIFFDPEYLSIMNADNEDLQLLTTVNDGGSYKLQFINTDRQKSKVVTIKIDDLRTSK